MVEPSKQARLYAQYISSMVGAIVMVILLVYHSYSTYNQPNPKKTINVDEHNILKKLYHGLSLQVSSFLMLICGVIYCAAGLSEIVWTDFISETRNTCYIHFLLIICSYGTFKMFMYIALSRRLVEAFGESTYFVVWEFFIISTSITFMILCGIFIELRVESLNRPPCNITFNTPFLITLVFYDFIVCIVNLILFLKPLCRLTNSIRSDGTKNKRFKKKYKILIKKNAVLATISFTTSFITWIILGIISGVAVLLQIIDIVVTSVAVLLLFTRNSWLYDVLCCCFNRKKVQDRDEIIESVNSVSAPSPKMDGVATSVIN